MCERVREGGGGGWNRRDLIAISYCTYHLVCVYECIGVRGGGEVQLHYDQNTYQRFRLLLGRCVCVYV